MTDVRINLDANTAPAEAKVAKLNQSLSRGAGNWRQQVEMSLKGLAGRTEGGAGLGMFKALAGGLGLVTAAAIAAGAGFSAYMAAADRAVESTKQQVEWTQRLRRAYEDATKDRMKTAAGGVGQAMSLRALRVSGGSLVRVRDLTQDGIETSDAIAGETRLMNLDERKRSAAAMGARRLALMGVSTYAEGVDLMSKNRGSLYRSWLEKTGRFASRSSRALFEAQAGRSETVTSRDNALYNINRSISESTVVPMAQAMDVEAGVTTRALAQSNEATLDPWSANRKQIYQEFLNTVEMMDEMAQRQYTMARAFKKIGSLFGGEGSEAQKRDRYVADHVMTPQ